MKRKLKNNLDSLLALIFVVFSLTNAIGQEKSKQQLKEESKLEKQKQTGLLVDSKEFVFLARTVLPHGGSTINLTTDDSTIEFRVDLIKSDLPFFGRAYSGVAYGGDNGMKFEGKPRNFTLEKTKKAYVIKMEVKGERDYLSILLSVYFDGSAYLSISSNNRSSISYNGDVKALQKK